MKVVPVNKTPKLRFRGFSGEWQEKKLGDIGENIIGLTYSPQDVVRDENGIIVLRSTNIKDYGMYLGDLVRVKQGTNINDRQWIKDGDILICVRNGSQRLIGKCYGLFGFEGTTFGAFMSVFRSPINDFVLLLFNCEQYKRQVHMNLGARINQITTGELNKFKFYLPERPEQKKIAGFLGEVDQKIEGLQKKKELLEKYKKGMMQKIFAQEIRFKDKNGKPFPAWQEKPLDEVGQTYNGLQNKTANDFGEGQDYITYKQIFGNSRIDVSKFDKVGIGRDENQNQAKKGDAFFTTSSETPMEVGLASVLLDDVEDVYLNSFCFGFRLDTELLPEYARFLFRSSSFRKSMARLAQGSTRYNISKRGFLKTVIFLPSTEEQQKIAELLTSLDDKIKLQESKLEQAKNFKKALLQQMFV